jgi:hypothetical protein
MVEQSQNGAARRWRHAEKVLALAAISESGRSDLSKKSTDLLAQSLGFG